MAKGSSSLRNKKSHSTKPYDVSNSFVKKVTSQVTSLLPQPAWLSKWFSPAVNNEVVQQEPESDDDDIEVIEPPPSKRAKIPLNRTFPASSFRVSTPIEGLREQQSQVEAVPSPIPNAFTDAVAGPSGLSSASRFAAPNFQVSSVHSENLEGKLNGDGGSESSESTSGCSSLVPQAVRQIQSETLASRRRSIDEKLNLTNHLQSPRSLFANRTRTPHSNTSLSRRRPSFNVSAFNSSLLDTGKLPSKDMSPFYAGRTMYGGASAYRRPREGMFMNELNTSKRGIQVRPVNENKDSADISMSHTARRILEALEQFSTPVQDAKRMPIGSPLYRPPLGSKRKWPINETTPTRRGGPSTNQLTIPTVPDLLKLRRRERLQDSMESARRIASVSSHVVEPYNIRTEEESITMKHHGKVNKAKPLDEELVTQVNLPNIALPITSLPKFDFKILPPSNNVKAFKFSSPIPVSSGPRSISSQGKFTFSLPLRKSDGHKITYENFIPSCPSVFESGKKEGSSVLKVKTNGQSSSSETGIKPASELKTGSVMDILGKNVEGKGSEDKSVSTSVGFGTAFKPAPGTWECDMCLLRNESSANQCIACENPRTKTSVPSNAYASQVQMQSDMWKCTSCLLLNKNSETSCVSCKHARFGTAPAKAASSAQWTCPDCLLRNSASMSECPACCCKKPQESGATTPQNTSAGDKSEKSWICPLCFVTNNNKETSCNACKRSRVEASTIPPPPPPIGTIKFNFTIPPEASKFKFGINNSGSVPVVSDTVKGFKFGETPTTTSAVNFVFGIPKTGDDDKAQDVEIVSSPKVVTSSAPTSSGSYLSSNNTPPTKSSPRPGAGFTFGNIQTQNANLTAKPAAAEGPKKRSASDMLSNVNGTKTEISVVSSSNSAIQTKRPDKQSDVVSTEKSISSIGNENSSNTKSSVTFAAPVFSSTLASSGSQLNATPTTGITNFFTTAVANSSFASVMKNTSSSPSSTLSVVCDPPAFKKPGFGSTLPTSANFTFGSSASESNLAKKTEENSTPKKQTVVFGSPTTNPLFGEAVSTTTTSVTTSVAAFTSSGTTNQGSTTTTPTFGTSTSTFTFGATKATKLNFSSPATSMPSFGIPTTKQALITSSTAPTFASPATTTTPSFGVATTVSSVASTASFGTSVTTTTPRFATPATTATPTFGNSAATASPSFGVPATAATPNFGVPVATTTPSFDVPATTTTPSFGIVASSTSSFGVSSSTPSFGSTPTSTAPSFGALGTTTPSFGTAPATNTQSFGPPAITSISFGTSTTPSTFGVPAATTTASFVVPASTAPSFGTAGFGSSTTPSFGTTTTSAFGSFTSTGQMKTSSQAPFVFGSRGSTGTPNASFTFSGSQPASTGSECLPAKIPSFGFGSSNNVSNTAQAAAPAPSFGSFTFTGAAGTPSAVTPSVFGASSAAGTPTNPVFGAGSTPSFGTSSTSGNFGSSGFNFSGSSQPFSFTGNQASSIQSPQNPTVAAPSFAFGQTQAPGQSAAPPTFNPHVRPTFDFTGGETPQFTAVSPVTPTPVRRIKKAVRRTVR